MKTPPLRRRRQGGVSQCLLQARSLVYSSARVSRQSISASENTSQEPWIGAQTRCFDRCGGLFPGAGDREVHGQRAVLAVRRVLREQCWSAAWCRSSKLPMQLSRITVTVPRSHP